MAEGGNLNIQKAYNKLIEDETSADESNDVQYEERIIEGDDAAKLCHFKKPDLTELSENFHCKISRKPPDGLARTLVIAFKPKYRQKIETHIVKMNLDMKKLEVRQFIFNGDKSHKLSEYLSSSERLEDKVCYIPDIVNSSVDIVGRSYDEVSKAEHRLKVYLEEIKVTGSRRIGRQVSDPGNNSSESVSKLESKAFSETVKASSLSGTDKDKVNTGKNKGFAKSYSGREFSRGSTPLTDDFHFETTLKNGFLLKVYKASITKLEVEVIVNAANNNMVHGGGVARVISRAAGWELDDESADHVIRNGNVKVTDNIVTTSGCLTQYKAIIHAVGPIWRDYRNKIECVDALADCVYNVLETCTKNRYRTVAMPAISAGIFGVPKELCADMYVDAAARYSKNLKPGDCPKELHIVDIDTSILKFVEVSVKKWQKDPQSVNSRVTLPKFLEENPHLVKRSNVNQDDVRGQQGQGGVHRGQDDVRGHQGQGGGHRGQGGGQRVQGGGEWEKWSEQGQIHENGCGGKITRCATKQDESSSNRYNLKNSLKYKGKETFRWGGQAEVFEMGQTISIKIFKGDVSKAQNMDAVVCCMDKYFNASGFVAVALRAAGGREYEKNFSKMELRNRMFSSKGSVYKCKAGSLGVHHVLHVVMEGMLTASEEEVRFYSECIYKVLSKADEWKYAKLVIPLFGTGLIKPDSLKATCVAVLRGIDRYLSDSHKGRVTEIHLVNKDEKVCKLLIEVFHVGVNTSASFRSGNLGLDAGNYRITVNENQNTGRSVWYVRGEKHESVESSMSGDRYEKQRFREKLGNTGHERISNEGQFEENRLSDGRYDGHGKRKHNENRSRKVDMDDSRVKHLQGPAVNAENSEVSDDSGSEMNRKPSTSLRQERKQTGNLNIIEN